MIDREQINWNISESGLNVLLVAPLLICLTILQRSFTLQWKEEEVAQSCLTLCDPVDCSLRGSSIHGIFQAIVLEWVAISVSRGSSRPRDRTQVSCIADRRFSLWAIREVILLYTMPTALLRKTTLPKALVGESGQDSHVSSLFLQVTVVQAKDGMSWSSQLIGQFTEESWKMASHKCAKYVSMKKL